MSVSEVPGTFRLNSNGPKKETVVSGLAVEFSSLPSEYQSVLSLAQERHNIKVTPLEELKGGRTGARLYLVSVSTPAAGPVKHFVLKLDHINPKARSDEGSRHSQALSQAPPDFARQHLPDLAFNPVEHDGAIAIFYAIAGQSLHHYRTLASYERQSQLETIFGATLRYLLSEWNAGLSFEQAIHPQDLLARWLTYRLKPGGNIERFLDEVFHMHPDTTGLLVQGNVYPNPWAYARAAERWGPVRPIDAIVGFQHSDLNIGNILVKFGRDEKDLAGYYLIDLALFKEGMPLLYDQRYLEMSYLMRELSRVPFPKWVDLVTRFAEEDMVDPHQVPIELAGACAVIGAGRSAFDRWVQAFYPSLSDDLWGQFWLAAVAVGLNYCNKAIIPGQERLAGLIFAAAHLKRYCTRFGAPLPVEAAHLYDASQADAMLPFDTPPLSPISTAYHLPAQPTPLIGREEEVAEVRDALTREEVRLLTLTGPGGTGKTRLGLQVATELIGYFPNGVFFVSLAEVSDPGLVVSKTAQQLGVREGGSQPLVDNLKAYLRDKQVLLLLDNFEHVLAAAPAVADLLAAAPGLKVLATSRAPLNLRGEHEFPVPPLKLPNREQTPPVERLGQYEAVRLFVERAQAANANFALTDQNASVVAEICHRLDGLPLAIELAAARVKLLSPQAMLARLSGSLKLLTGGPRDLPARQQTLRNTLDWSYRLLDPDEQTLFARLGVFVGGFTLEAAEVVCKADGGLDMLEGVASLVNNSLLRTEQGAGGQSRFRMLETIREYALERLEDSGELEIARRAHALYYAGVIIDGGWSKLFSSDATPWLDWLESEHDNVRAALTWSQATPEGLELGPPFIDNLTWYWYRRGYFDEGRTRCEQVLASSVAAAGTPGRATALMDSGMMAMWQGDLKAAVARAEESLAIWKQLEDEHGLPIALMWNGIVLVNMGADEDAHPLLKQAQAWFRRSGDSYFYAVTIVHLGNVALGLGDPVEARAWLDEAHALSREIDEDWLISFALNNLGEVARVGGDYDQARAYYEESEALLRAVGDQGDLARLVHNLGHVAQHQGDYQRAEAQFKESLALFRKLGNKRGIAECLAGLASLRVAGGQPERAAKLLGAAQATLSASGAAWWPADRVEVERNLAAIRAGMDEDVFTAAWEAGAVMTLEGAIAYASQDI
jgi:predicted ATPase